MGTLGGMSAVIAGGPAVGALMPPLGCVLCHAWAGGSLISHLSFFFSSRRVLFSKVVQLFRFPVQARGFALLVGALPHGTGLDLLRRSPYTPCVASSAVSHLAPFPHSSLRRGKQNSKRRLSTRSSNLLDCSWNYVMHQQYEL